MPTTYEEADAARPIMADLIRKHYPDLEKCEVTIGLYFAHAPRDKDDQPKPPALKLHGVAAAGIIRVNSYKDRSTKGATDVTILLDGDEWPEWTDKRRRAVIHHELEHIELQYDDEGNLKSDDIGRPKIKLKPHDVDLGGFSCIAKRYGDDAPEVELAKKAQQCLLFPEMQQAWG